MSVLKLRHIGFRYGHGEQVLDDVNLRVSSDERVVLSAPSGFGKSTLCRVAAGYLQPDSGDVLLDGEPVDGRGVCPVQLVMQHPEQALDPLLTMRASLTEAGPVDDDLVAALGIRTEWMTRYPRELSGGELQRFCIARALRAHPRFLIADEISTMLDAVTQAQIWEFLLDYCTREDIGIVAVTHSPALADRIATRTVELAHLGAARQSSSRESMRSSNA